MSINMSNVKSITLGGQNVKKIEDKNGNVLWKDNNTYTTTISLTVGEGQDITSTQYRDAIRIPSSNAIKNAIGSKIGIASSGINVKKVELDLSTLYWHNVYSGKQTPKLSTSSSNTSGTTYFASGIERTSNYVFEWSNYKLDVTQYMNTRLFGYCYEYDRYNPRYRQFGTSSGDSSTFCQSYGSGLPIFTIVVTYEC